MEPLKNVYSPAFLDALSSSMLVAQPNFDTAKFKRLIFDNSWKDKALKARMQHISESLHACLSDHLAGNVAALQIANTELNQRHKMQGFEAMFFPDYVARFALQDFDMAMPALAFFTQLSSAEFAIRPFILRYPEATMQQMLLWAKHENEHVRRLASEGCRPRLPWAMQLPNFIQDPSPIFPMLALLKNDESAYVRRSVANNLNDIAKDHPELVSQTAKEWMGKNQHTDKLIKHACRTLLKQAHPQTLALFGYTPADHIQLVDFRHTSEVPWHGEQQFSFTLLSQAPLGKIRLEFAISFMKKNGQPSRKVFQISEFETKDMNKNISKTFSFKPISTRTYYPGRHRLDIILNGQTLGWADFTLSD